ncbi:transforming growth factor beta-1-induced transcript 1 protein-like [Ischnura elegans]|uniref:transforming growth factor beta-1-induced transcript 1 protein-like n=1 Tax=Ischnura elegans TaxID=197161 RepID=UPI001ED88043|nr:transforming growth factor beta-1-induced transcript 1 protein-like [Ischnura elegans]
MEDPEVHSNNTEQANNTLIKTDFQKDSKVDIPADTPNTTATVCAACNKEITEKGVLALQKMWHSEHFQCVYCKIPITDDVFFEEGGEPYCEEDYNNLFMQKCAECEKPITDTCVAALGKKWHRECFACAECGNKLGGETFMEKDGKCYCKDCYHKLFTVRCHTCKEPITDTCVIAVGKNWHKKCFVCERCKNIIDTANFVIEGGSPRCLGCASTEPASSKSTESASPSTESPNRKKSR